MEGCTNAGVQTDLKAQHNMQQCCFLLNTHTGGGLRVIHVTAEACHLAIMAPYDVGCSLLCQH